jgi:hypothetical protein
VSGFLARLGDCAGCCKLICLAKIISCRCGHWPARLAPFEPSDLDDNPEFTFKITTFRNNSRTMLCQRSSRSFVALFKPSKILRAARKPYQCPSVRSVPYLALPHSQPLTNTHPVHTPPSPLCDHLCFPLHSAEPHWHLTPPFSLLNPQHPAPPRRRRSISSPKFPPIQP